MENKLLIAKLIKKNGRLVFRLKEDQALFLKFADSMREGQTCEQLTNFEKDDGKLSQIAKVHAMIKDIANETGDTVQNTKLETKRRCGLVGMQGDVKSFADCSFQELSDVIQTLIEMGDFLNLNLR